MNGRAESIAKLDFAVSGITAICAVLFGTSGSSRVANIASTSWLPRICFSSTPAKENASGLQL
jgi:hypothetical protein